MCYYACLQIQIYKVDVNVEKNEDGDHLLHTAVAGGEYCFHTIECFMLTLYHMHLSL